jgi:hypothetical protein
MTSLSSTSWSWTNSSWMNSNCWNWNCRYHKCVPDSKHPASVHRCPVHRPKPPRTNTSRQYCNGIRYRRFALTDLRCSSYPRHIAGRYNCRRWSSMNLTTSCCWNWRNLKNSTMNCWNSRSCSMTSCCWNWKNLKNSTMNCWSSRSWNPWYHKYPDRTKHWSRPSRRPAHRVRQWNTTRRSYIDRRG